MDFKKPFPEPKSLKCAHYWHFKKSGLTLAIYDLVGAITAGGKNEFFVTKAKVAKYFDADYETVRRVFVNLRRTGWLELLLNGHHRYISHDERAEKFPKDCKERPLLAWQVDNDPLVGQMYAMSGGKLRVFEKQVASIRGFGFPDERIIDVFGQALKIAEKRKARGQYDGTSPKSCFWRAYYFLKEEKQRLAHAQTTSPLPAEVTAALRVIDQHCVDDLLGQLQ